MDNKTRVKAAITHLPVDRVPCAELIINDKLIEELHSTKIVDFEHRLDFIRVLGLDAICVHPLFQPAQAKPTADSAVFRDLDKWVNTGRFIFAVLDGPLGWGTRILGFEQLMSKLGRKHADYLDLSIFVEKLNFALIEKLASQGIDGIILADDIAFTQGVYIRPDVLRQVFFPSLARQVEYAKLLNIPVFYHSDGNLMTVMDDIVAAGFDGLQCLEKQAGMDIAILQKQYGGKLCLWGNFDPADLIQPINLADLAAKVRAITKGASQNGGLIFGTSSGLFEGMIKENIQAIYKIARKDFEYKF